MASDRTIGSVKLRMSMKTLEYSVESTFQNELDIRLFYMFLIDKILADCLDRSAALNILGNAYSAMRGYGKVFDEIKNVSSRFNISCSMPSFDFGLDAKYLVKSYEKGEHQFVITNYEPLGVPNISRKTVILFSLYAMYLRNTLTSETIEYLEAAVLLLFKEYNNGNSLPTMMSVTKAPTDIINRLINR